MKHLSDKAWLLFKPRGLRQTWGDYIKKVIDYIYNYFMWQQSPKKWKQSIIIKST